MMDLKVNSCRICLDQEGFKSIFEEQDNIFISKKIVYCASVQISEDDVLPKMICGQCLFYLDIAYAFRTECESSDKKIRNLQSTEKEEIGKMLVENNTCQNLDHSTSIDNIEMKHLKEASGETVLVQYYEDTQNNCTEINILNTQKSILNTNIPELYTESLNENCLENSKATEGENLVPEGTNCISKRYRQKKCSNDKVGRHIAKKISGKLPQRLHQKNITTSDNRSQICENNFINKVLNDLCLGTKCEGDTLLKIECNTPMVISEETVVTDEDFPYKAEIDHIDEIQDNTQYANVSSEKLKPKIVKKLKMNSKLKMILRKNNRKVNVFKSHCKNSRKHKGTAKERLKNTEGELLYRKIHKTKDGFKCDICNKQFAYKSHLKRHLNKHTGTKLYSCKFCKQKFVNNYNLNVHMSKHTGVFPLKCEICNRGLPNPSLLKRHMTSHTGEQQFQCRYCSVKFRQSSSLRTHEKMHLNRPSYHCDICFKVFSYTNSLTAHKKIHFEAQRFPCDSCLSTFSRKSSLVRHMKEHTKSKQIRCKFCNLSFQSKSSYNSHLKTHCKYKCGTCGEGFRYKSNFSEHVKQHKNQN